MSPVESQRDRPRSPGPGPTVLCAGSVRCGRTDHMLTGFQARLVACLSRVRFQLARGAPRVERMKRTEGSTHGGRSDGRPVRWPADIPVPQASIEFEVADVASAAAELTAKGYRLIHEARTEPWSQVTARLLSPEGLLTAVCYTPSFHDESEA